MARFRDVKQGRIKESKNVKNIVDLSLCSASLMSRFKAFLTDTFILTMPLMYIVFYFIMGSREEFAQDKLLGWLYIFLPHFIVILSFWFFKQQTPGLKAYELSIIDINTGEKPRIVSLINRYIQTGMAIILILPMFLPYIRKDKKTLQDIMSETCITNTPNKPLPKTKN